MAYHWHVTQLTDEAAMRHARLCCGILDKPEIGIGWQPYNYIVEFGAVNQWACHTAAEFERRLRAAGLMVREWGPWSDGGVRSARLETVAEHTLRLAWERGKIRSTFATADEYRTPGYGDAWAAGREAGQREREGES
jgi:hypothetical protein